MRQEIELLMLPQQAANQDEIKRIAAKKAHIKVSTFNI